jgi:hypothetical protein
MSERDELKFTLMLFFHSLPTRGSISGSCLPNSTHQQRTMTCSSWNHFTTRYALLATM